MARELQQFDVSDEWSAILQAIDADGGAIVQNFLDENLYQRLVDELAPVADNFKPGMEGGVIKQLFCGEQTKRFSGLVNRAPSFSEVIDHDLLHAWAEHGFSNDYWMNTGQAMIVGPGSEAQFLHRDAANWPVSLLQGKGSPEATLSAMIALTDFTRQNGATQVVPGSHQWDDFDRPATAEEITQAVMPARAAMLYTGKTIHGAGANDSADDWRFGLHISFVLAQFTPEEAHPVLVPWEKAQQFSERVQHMLGYASHRTSLPDWPILWTSDYRDVRETLNPAASGEYKTAGEKFLRGLGPM